MFAPPHPRTTLSGITGATLLALVCVLVTPIAPLLPAAEAAAPIPAPPAVNARAWLLQDFHSGAVLSEHNADERMEPASLVKLMTAYIVFSEIRAGTVGLGDQVLVSEKAWRMPGSRMFIEVNTRVSVEDLLQGMIIQSGNDASVALAEHVAGSESAFADLMNEYARSLGMTGTHYTNSTGLPDADLYTTAHDLTLLTRAMIRRFPEYYQWYSVREFTYNGITQPNRNRLLWRDGGVDGVKTGHTQSAGFCLVTSAERDNMRLVTVVLGTASEEARMVETQKLLNYGFRFFETHRLYEAGAPVTTARVWQGATQELTLGLEDDLYVTIPRNQYDRLAASTRINPALTAPIRRGDAHGSVEVTLDDANLAMRPLIALQSVEEGGFFQRMTDRVMMMFE
jgi:serine-type D-Ala-D-Ala carboxypeptidase (penicillin-binding protein 5/6)